MRGFDQIYQIAADRHGGTEAVEQQLSKPLSAEALAAIPEDRWLSKMTKCIFQAGFSWKVIDAKWDGFEAAFEGFDPGRCAMMDDDWFDQLVQDKRIVRNAKKIITVRDNAAFLLELRDQGGAGHVFGGWPTSDFVGLLELLKKRGSHLGGNAGQLSMRFMGCDSFMLSRDVTARLVAEGVIDKPATSKTALRAVQAAFNEWVAQSGRSMTEVSKVLALSV